MADEPLSARGAPTQHFLQGKACPSQRLSQLPRPAKARPAGFRIYHETLRTERCQEAER